MADTEAFRNHIIEAGILDPEGVHHELVTGMHGQKLDFDGIETGTPLYEEWVAVTADFIRNEYVDQRPEMIIGVANGTNRLAVDVARRLGEGVIGLVSKKDRKDSKVLYLGDRTRWKLADRRPELVIVKEDVSTTGSNSVQVARHALAAGAQDVEVVTTWKRRAQLEKLQQSGIVYRSIIDEELPTFEPEECHAVGFCAKGWRFIERAT